MIDIPQKLHANPMGLANQRKFCTLSYEDSRLKRMYGKLQSKTIQSTPKINEEHDTHGAICDYSEQSRNKVTQKFIRAGVNK